MHLPFFKLAHDETPIVDELALDNTLDSLQWSIYVIAACRTLLSDEPPIVRERLRTDADFRASVRELYKVLLIDRSGARVREACADGVMDRFHQLLISSGEGDLQSLGEAKVLHRLLPAPPPIELAEVQSMQPRLSCFPRLHLPISGY